MIHVDTCYTLTADACIHTPTAGTWCPRKHPTNTIPTETEDNEAEARGAAMTQAAPAREGYQTKSGATETMMMQFRRLMLEFLISRSIGIVESFTTNERTSFISILDTC